MKKLLAACLAALLALGLFAFAGCDEGTSVGGDTDPDTIVSDELTEAEWDDAFAPEAFENYTMKLTESSGGETSSATVKVAATETGTLACENDGDEVYYEVAAGKTHYYYKEDGAWQKKELTGYDPANYLTYAQLVAGEYGKLPYDGTQKAYTAENYTFTNDIKADKVTVKFADKKLAYVRYDITEGQTSGSIEVLFYDYGTTSVTLPSLGGEEPSDGKMSQTEWEAAFAPEVFENCEIAFDISTDLINSDGSILREDFMHHTETHASEITPEKELYYTESAQIDTPYGYAYKYYGEKRSDDSCFVYYNDSEENTTKYHALACSESDAHATLLTPAFLMSTFSSLYGSAQTEENGTYLLEEIEWELSSQGRLTLDTVALTFQDGKVSSLSATRRYGSPSSLHNATITASFTYGGTSLTLPTEIAVDEYTPAEAIVSEELDDAEWAAAFANGVFTNLSFSVRQSGAVVQEEVIEFSQTGGTTHIRRELDTPDLSATYYYEFTADGDWRYSYGDNFDWIKQTTQEAGDNFTTDTYFAMVGALAQMKTQLTFANGAYTAESVAMPSLYLSFTDVTLKFLDGRLVYAQFTQAADGTGTAVTSEIRLYNYGTTEVDLPNAA